MRHVPKGPINSILWLVWIMAWRRPGDKPSSKLIMAILLTLICVTRPNRVQVLCTLDWCPHRTTHIKENLIWHIVQEQANRYKAFHLIYHYNWKVYFVPCNQWQITVCNFYHVWLISQFAYIHCTYTYNQSVLVVLKHVETCFKKFCSHKHFNLLKFHYL